MVEEVGLRVLADGTLQVVVDGVSAVDGARILLSGHERVALPHVLSRLAPRRLLEVGNGDVPHLEQVRDVDVLRRDLRPHGVVLRVVARDMDVGVAGVPPLRGEVRVALEGDGEIRRLIRAHLEGPLVAAVLGAARRDEFVAPDREAGLVGTVDVEGEAVFGRPPRARVHPQETDLVGEAVDEDGALGGERSATGRVVEAKPGGDRSPARRILHRETQRAVAGRDGRGVAAHDLDVAQGDPLRAADGEVRVADAVRGEAGALQRHPGGGEHRAGRGGGLGFDGGRFADSVAAVVVEPDAERSGEFRRVRDREVDGLIDVEREGVLDVEGEEGADDARPVADVARLKRIAAAVHAEFRAGDAERAGDVLPRPLEFDDVAGLAPVRRRARPRRQGIDRIRRADRACGTAERDQASRHREQGNGPRPAGAGAQRS